MTYVAFILGTIGYLFCFLLLAKLKLWEMHNNLDEWIHIGIGDDIHKAKEQRPEYQYYVRKIENDPHKKINIPRNTVKMIRSDLKYFVRPVYFWILWLWITRKLK